jgi:hypothetical protein
MDVLVAQCITTLVTAGVAVLGIAAAVAGSFWIGRIQVLI